VVVPGPWLSMPSMVPTPVAPNEQLPEPLSLNGTECRQERPRFPRHFYWCDRCGRRYAAWEASAPSESSSR
jgi:hypothetical protein